MNGKQLKNSILQLAIQGKLVPQDPTDEPASVLLQRIRKEKEQLVKEGKLKKKDLVMSPILEDEVPFDIPESWTWCRLGDIGSWGSGATPAKGKPEYYSNGTIPWLRTGELNNGYVYDSEIKVTQAALDNCSLRMCCKGDVLIAMYGATIGKVAIAGIELTTNQACCACTPIQIFNEYLMWYLMASKQAFIELGEGGAQPNISREKIIVFPFAVPPLSEQHRIVAKIEELMPLVEDYDKAQTKLDDLNAKLPEALKKSILQEAIQGKIVPQDPTDEPASVLLQRIRKEKEQLVKDGKLKKKDLVSEPITDEEKPFEIPESWEWCRLQDLVSLISDGTHKTPSYKESGVPFLSVQNISSGKLSLDRIKYISEEEHQKLCERVKPQLGDILVCRIGTLGKALEITWDFEFSIFVSLGLLRPICADVTPYIKLFINSPIGKAWIDDVKVGGGTHTYKINLSDFPNMLIPMPPLQEQHRIIAKIEELFGVLK